MQFVGMLSMMALVLSWYAGKTRKLLNLRDWCYAGVSVTLGYSRHSLESGNPDLEANHLDSRLRGNDEANRNNQANDIEGKFVTL